MRKKSPGITDFDIGIGWRTPSYYRTVSQWVLDAVGGPPLSEISRLRTRGLPWSLTADVTFLGFFIQIQLTSISKIRGGTE